MAELDLSTPESAREEAEKIISGAHTITDVAEATSILGQLTPYAEALEVLGEAVEPVGWALFCAELVLQTLGALETGAKIAGCRGAAYGIMVGAMNEPDPPCPPFGPEADHDEMEAAWNKGVQEGRAKVSDPVIRNKVLLSVAKHGPEMVLNSIWHEVAAREPACQPVQHLNESWPTPQWLSS